MPLAKQPSFFSPAEMAYGSTLMSARKGRPKGGRPLSTKDTMHLVIRSSKARGDWSFRRRENAALVQRCIKRFADKHFIRVFKVANVGNHLHLHIRVQKRWGYRPFIRALTSAIAVGITRVNHGAKALKSSEQTPPQAAGVETRGIETQRLKFFDLRPFTRVIKSLRAFLTLHDYIRINELEGAGLHRGNARLIVAWESRWRGA